MRGSKVVSVLITFFWIIFPVIVLFASNYLVTTFKLQERFKIKAPDVAVLLLFIGLHALSENIFHSSVLPYYIISIFLLGISVAVFQGYFYEEINYARFFKMFWRMTFLMTMLLYVIFIILSFIM
ncbi:MAG: DUF3397 domain-containing protein [Lactobacillales bacterium]|nr:DUF3397 domain-containing protein [Lactobacillales bacterium]